MLLPPPLRPGEPVRIIAPSGPFELEPFEAGLSWLRERYEVRLDPGIYSKHRFFAGTDERRSQELEAALDEPDTRALFVARGGWGIGRIAANAAWARLRERPKWLVGFSDVTALHQEAQRVGVASLHASNVTGLARATTADQEALVDTLSSPARQRVHPGLEVWYPGSASGPLVGGNLTVMFTCAASGSLHLPRGCILLVEDTSELSYRLDRTLTALLQGRHLDGVAGIVVGDFHDCKAGRHAVEPLDAVRERLLELRVPMLAGLPVGHGDRNAPIVLGSRATLGPATVEVGEGDRDRGTLTLGE